MTGERQEPDHDLLQEIRENRVDAVTEWQQVREEARKDRLCVAGKVWEAMDPEAASERRENKRPCLSSDEIGQYINQTVNDVRANPRGIKYAPTANGANEQGAEFYQNHTREIEYRSKASIVYASAFTDAVSSSYGWVRVSAKRAHARTFDQDLYIDLVANPDQILPDPTGVWPDSSDIKFLYHLEPWSRTVFERTFPKTKAAKFTLDTSRLAPGWIDRNTVQVASYWKLESVERTLVAYRPAGQPQAPVQTALVDELPDKKLPAGVDNIREETVEDTTVKSWLTNGLEILKPQPWVGKYIPYVSCYGKILYVDEGGGSRRHILSMTRLARDPAMAHAYMVTCEAEAVGGVARAQWVGYEGQFAKPKVWQEANHKPVAFLEAKVTVPGAPTPEPLPLPQRQSWDPPLQNLEIAIEARRRAIQAAMGISPQPTETQRRNDISGEAWKQRQAMGQRGSFHFVDAYNLMIERVGVIVEDQMDRRLDTARNVPVRKSDDSSQIVRINDPNGVGPDGAPQDPIFTKGDYRVTVSTGPANDSQREAAVDFVQSLVGNLQVVAQLAGPLRALKLLAKSVKVQQLGPIGDEIIDLLDPKQVGQDGKPLSPEVAQLLGENQQLKQMLDQAKQMIQGKVAEKQADAAGKLRIVQEQEAHQDDRAAKDREVKLAVAELSARVDRMALLLEESKLVGARQDEAVQATHDRVHEDVQRVKDRTHEHLQGQIAHARAKELSAQAHDQALEAGAQGVAGQLATQQQAADLAPEPAAGGGE